MHIIPTFKLSPCICACTAGLSQTCFSQPNCQGDMVQPGVVVTARDCCVGTNEGMSFSSDVGTCIVQQCIRKNSHSLASMCACQ